MLDGEVSIFEFLAMMVLLLKGRFRNRQRSETKYRRLNLKPIRQSTQNDFDIEQRLNIH